MKRSAFELLVLGCSSASPAGERNVSAQLLNVCERYFLIDCGEGTQMQLRKYKARMQSIAHICISHLHGDHFFGLPGLLSSMHLLGRRTSLRLYGPPALKELLDTMNKATDTYFSFPLEFVPTQPSGMHLLFEDDRMTLHSFPLQHRIACTGFLFREKPLPRKIDKDKLRQLDISFADILALKAGMDVVNGSGAQVRNADATLDPPPARSYAYCSDTIYDLRVAEYVRNVDLLYHESTFLEDNRERAAKTYHSTAAQAADVAARAGVGQLLLGHYSARYRELDRFLEEAQPVFANCLLAEDGKKVTI